MSRRYGSWAVAGVVAVAGGLLAGCGGSSSSATTTTARPATTTTSAPAPSLTPAQQSELEPKVLTAADFPSGWTRSTSAGAVSPAGAPSCVANLVTAKGSAFRTSAAFLSSAANPAVVIQTVASFPSGTAASATSALDASFLACNGKTVSLGAGQTARLATGPVNIGPIATGAFAGQMTVTAGTQREYLYLVTGTKGDLATLVVWRSVSQATAPFAATATKALARL
jgi:hypothetical protein